MENYHSQGRPGAGAHTLQRAHARRLLVTLAGVCRHLRMMQSSPAVREACWQVEQDLRRLPGLPGKPALAQTTEQWEP
jgi:hypothetical protein